MAAPKRATIPGSTFDSKASRVIGKLTEAPMPAPSETAEEVEVEVENLTRTTTGEVATPTVGSGTNTPLRTVKPSNSNTLTRQEGNKADIKVTFYLTEAQVDKLDELVFKYKKRRGKRINRNDIIRHLIENITSEDIEASDIG